MSQEPQTNWKETDWSAYLAKELGQSDTTGNGDNTFIPVTATERVLPDGSRIDICQYSYNETICWEVEWCDKWEEAIGQSMYYYLSLRNTPGNPHAMGIYLLKKPEDDEDYIRCLMCVNELKSKGFPVYLRVQKVNK